MIQNEFLTLIYSQQTLKFKNFLAVEWIMQHRGDLDILIHPNSGAELSDHKIWSSWYKKNLNS